MRVLLLVRDGHAERLERAVEAAELAAQRLTQPSAAEQSLRAESVDALVFDTDLVDADFLPRVRRQHPGQTLIAWLSYASSDDAGETLRAGADEVLDTSMGHSELSARLAKAARHGSRAPPAMLELGPLSVDVVHGEARWRDRRLALTRREREVLHVLAEAAGRTVRREVLYRQVWGYAMARGDRSVDVNVKRLRDKLTEAGSEVTIQTEPGIGYRLEVTPATAPVTAL